MDSIHKLKLFMLTTDNVNSFFLKDQPLKKQSRKKQKEVSTVSIPKFENTLFWCFYIMKYGLTEYTLLNHSFKEEQRVKIQLISLIREKRDKLKRGKFKRIKTENDLLYSKKISLQTFLCLCYLNDINILIIDENKYTERIFNEQEKINVIKKHIEQYGIYVCEKNEIQSFRENYWEVDNIAKPLKSFSSYKAKDIRNICKKLNISIYDDNKRILNMKKLYERIIQKI